MPTQIMVFTPPEGASAEVLRDILNIIIETINNTARAFGLGDIINGQFEVDQNGVGRLPLFTTVRLGPGGINALVSSVATIIISLTVLTFTVTVVEPAVRGEAIPLGLLVGGGILGFLWLTRGRR